MWRAKTNLPSFPGPLLRAVVERRTAPGPHVPCRARCESLYRRSGLFVGCWRAMPDAPRSLEFTVGAFGKPELQPSAGIHFSVSHSAGLTVCVVSRAPVGVDIERIRDIPDALSIAQQFFSTTEAAALRDADASDISRELLMCWTRKEAIIKANGLGPLAAAEFILGQRGSRLPSRYWTAKVTCEARRRGRYYAI